MAPAGDQHAYRVTLRYDGRGYFGWQRLQDRATIQGTLERAIEAAFGHRRKVRGASRTDRGAHAEGQVAGFLLPEPLPAEALIQSLNAALPDDIEILDAAPAPMAFHPRESALSKVYTYRIDTREALPKRSRGRVWHHPVDLDLDLMQSALTSIVGKLDFASFATRPRHQQRSTVRTMLAATASADGPRFEIELHADSFLQHMVRNIVRAVVRIGQGELPPEHMTDILAARQRDASRGTAPASGLYLTRIFYDDSDDVG